MQFSGTSSRVVVVCDEDKEKVPTSSFSVAVVEAPAPMLVMQKKGVSLKFEMENWRVWWKGFVADAGSVVKEELMEIKRERRRKGRCFHVVYCEKGVWEKLGFWLIRKTLVVWKVEAKTYNKGKILGSILLILEHEKKKLVIESGRVHECARISYGVLINCIIIYIHYVWREWIHYFMNLFFHFSTYIVFLWIWTRIWYWLILKIYCVLILIKLSF